MHCFLQESQQSKLLLCVCTALSTVCFLAKWHESCTHIILLLGFGLDADHKEITESRDQLNYLLQLY